MQLTDISIRSLKAPEKGQISYPDDAVPGFGVRVSPGGAKTYVLIYGRARRRKTIGRVGVVKLKDARQEARKILAQRTLGKRDSQAISFERAFAIFSEIKAAEK